MGGKKYLEQFVVDSMQDIGSRELATLRSSTRHLKRDLSQAQLTKMSLDDVVETYKCMNLSVGAPQLWTVLWHLACTTSQQSRNTYKSPTLVCSVLCSAGPRSNLNSTAGYYLYHVDVIVFTISSQQRWPEIHYLVPEVTRDIVQESRRSSCIRDHDELQMGC